MHASLHDALVLSKLVRPYAAQLSLLPVPTPLQRWHLSCLRCAECCQSAVDGTSRIERNDRVYCKPCYIRVFLSTCTACKKPITGEVRSFSRLHFTCPQCM